MIEDFFTFFYDSAFANSYSIFMQIADNKNICNFYSFQAQAAEMVYTSKWARLPPEMPGVAVFSIR